MNASASVRLSAVALTIAIASIAGLPSAFAQSTASLQSPPKPMARCAQLYGTWFR